MISSDEHAIPNGNNNSNSNGNNNSNGNENIDDSCNNPVTLVTPKKLSKSYVYQSDHSLVAVLRRREDEDDDDEISAWSGSDDSEAALTRVHRFCWAVCCCRSSSCCLQEQEVSDITDEQGHQGLQEKKRRCSMLVSILRAQFLHLRQKLEFAEHG